MATHKRVTEAVEEYIQFRRHRVARTTWENEAFVFRRFAAYLGDMQLRNVTADHISAWFYGEQGLLSEHFTRDRLRRRGIQPSTANYYRTRLAGLFRYLTARGHLRVDLLVDVPALPVVTRRRQQPPPRALLGLLGQAADARDRAYLATAINTACRASEIVRLRVGDVDLVQGWLALRVEKTHEEDLAPITSDLDRELRAWLTAYSAHLGRDLRDEDYLIPASSGSVYEKGVADDPLRRVRTQARWHPDRAATHTERIVQSALRSMGLPTLHEGTHTIRRAVARAFFDSMDGEVGYDAALRTVSALLHHKSSATTEKYLGLTSERRRRDERLRGQPFLSSMLDDTNVLPMRRTAR